MQPSCKLNSLTYSGEESSLQISDISALDVCKIMLWSILTCSLLTKHKIKIFFIKLALLLLLESALSIKKPPKTEPHNKTTSVKPLFISCSKI